MTSEIHHWSLKTHTFHVSSPRLGYHCLFVNIPLYVIVFGYRLFIDLFIIFFNCSLIDDRSLFRLYFNTNYFTLLLHSVTVRRHDFNLLTLTLLKNDQSMFVINWPLATSSTYSRWYFGIKTRLEFSYFQSNRSG